MKCLYTVTREIFKQCKGSDGEQMCSRLPIHCVQELYDGFKEVPQVCVLIITEEGKRKGHLPLKNVTPRV